MFPLLSAVRVLLPLANAAVALPACGARSGFTWQCGDGNRSFGAGIEKEH